MTPIMVMRSYCLDFLARRGETPHREHFTIKYNLNFKTGSRKTNRSQLPKQALGTAGLYTGTIAGQSRDKCPWGTQPEQYTSNTIPAPKAQGTGQRGLQEPKEQEACGCEL